MKNLPADRLMRRKLLLGLGILSAVLIFFFILIYAAFQNALIQSANTMSSEFLQQVNSTVSSAEDILQILSAQIFNMTPVRKLRSGEALTEEEITEGLRTLTDFSTFNSAVNSIYVYDRKQGFIYSTDAHDSFCNNAAGFPDREAVLLMHGANEYNRMIPIRRSRRLSAGGSAPSEMISLMVFETGENGKADGGIVMLNFESKWISDLYLGTARVNASYIVDINYFPVIGTDGRLLPYRNTLMKQIGAAPGNGSFPLLIDGEEHLCCYSKMKNDQFYYVTLMPYSAHMTGLLQVRSGTFWLLILGMLLSLGAFCLIAEKLWLPLLHMQSSLAKASPGAGGKDPLQQLNTLIDRSTDSMRMNRALRATLKEYALTGLLLGDEKGLPDYSEYDIALQPGRPLHALLVSTNRAARVAAVARPLCPLCESVEMAGEHTVLLLQPETPEVLEAVCTALTAENDRWQVFVSPPLADPAGLPAAYERLSDRLSLRWLYSPQRVCSLPQETPVQEPAAAEEPLADLLSSLRGGQESATMDAYRRFVEALRRMKPESAVFELKRMNQSVLRLWDDDDPEARNAAAEDAARFEAGLPRVRQVEELDAFFEDSFVRICEKRRQDKKKRQSVLMTDIEQTIVAEFRDPALSLQQLADRFGMSAPYLGRMFKQYSGRSVQESITACRIAEAERLLRETDIKIKDFGPLIGVENLQYFFVLFKQQTGMTPRQYRLSTRPNAGEDAQEN